MAEVEVFDEGDSILGRYEVMGELGRGGFGVVYKGKQVQTGQLVAIKTVSTSLSYAGFCVEDGGLCSVTA